MFILAGRLAASLIVKGKIKTAVEKGVKLENEERGAMCLLKKS